MSARSDVLLWAQRVIARKTGPAHLMLEVRESASLDQVQEAFHKIARTSHPDLHRTGLTPDELELVTSAYAAVAGAYMQMRSQSTQTTRGKALSKDEPIAADGPRTPPSGSPTVRASSPAPAGLVGGTAGAVPAQSMSQKALTYYRKAESCLKRGDLKGATLQIKLAIAADPTSAFLRSALAEVDAELRKGT